jgi:23S rRNA (adenine2503-C2)-methyltransferase
MIEYIMIKGVNDADADAELLARKLHGISCKINLLPYNETSSLGYEPSPMERIERFREILRNHGYTALLRTSRGADISAACGQLAAKER